MRKQGDRIWILSVGTLLVSCLALVAWSAFGDPPTMVGLGLGAAALASVAAIAALGLKESNSDRDNT